MVMVPEMGMERARNGNGNGNGHGNGNGIPSHPLRLLVVRSTITSAPTPPPPAAMPTDGAGSHPITRAPARIKRSSAAGCPTKAPNRLRRLNLRLKALVVGLHERLAEGWPEAVRQE